ncbi:MAG: DUF2062 domain-containing protein [Planctomycetes bacterium]|nr:DUF2062 domain-containing protein [Planctomycetota bacterium]MBU1518594.1 DUF2062 domain-containing protein [Planctomycetota bacterium]MBU2458101.1 DUF2062 domain-containing protein [Planctomycetota bacterium]MBU2597342.1 DUF2062 domain-containing protein [Planctomycetota bacterium]
MARKRKHPILRYLEYKILHIDDSPAKIALGLAIGLFVAWMPILGIRSLMVIALSILLRANKFAGLVSVWVSNVFTFVLIYYPSYLIGRAVYAPFVYHETLSGEQVLASFNRLFAPANIFTGFYTKEYWRQFWVLTKTIGPELWIGGFILGGLVAISSYVICYNLIKNHRAKSPHRRYRHY